MATVLPFPRFADYIAANGITRQVTAVRRTLLIVILFAVAALVGIVAVGHLAGRRLSARAPADAARVDTETRPLLIVGEDWAPFEYEENKRVMGIDAEALAHVFRRLQIRHEIRLYPWSRAEMMAKSGKADMLISVSYKKERESFLVYTDSQREFGRSGEWPADYLWDSEYVFFCRLVYEDKIRYDSLAQVKADGYKVGTVRGYTYNEEFLAAGLSTFTAPDFDSGMQFLAEGRYDLFPADRTVGLAAIKRLKLTGKVAVLPRVIFRKPYLMPCIRGSTYPDTIGIMHRVYAELARMRASGEYGEIWRRYTQ